MAKGRKQCPACQELVGAPLKQCSCGWSFTTGSMQPLPTPKPKLRQGRKRCPACQELVGIALKQCSCGWSFTTGSMQPLPTPKPKPKSGRFTIVGHNLRPHRYLHRYDSKLSEEQRQEIRQMLGTRTLREIASQMGLPLSRINAFLYQQRNQRQMELPQHRPNPVYERAAHLWAEGWTIKEIAQDYGYRADRMAGIIERYRKHFGWFPKRNRTAF